MPGTGIVEMVTPPAASRLTDLVTIKAILGISGTAEDAYLLRLVDQATEAIVTDLGPVARATYAESFPGMGRTEHILGRVYVESVSEVRQEGAAFDDWQLRRFGDRQTMGILYREGGWTWSPGSDGIAGDPLPGTERSNFAADYTAGYLLPGQVATWTASASVAAGAWLRPATAGLTMLLFRAGGAGALGASEPVWPTSSGGTVVSGAVTLTGFPARELPADLQEAADEEVLFRYRENARDPSVASKTIDGWSRSYREARPAAPRACAIIKGYKF